MNLINTSGYEIKTYLVSPAGDTMPGNTMRAIIEQWEALQNSVSLKIIAINNVPPVITIFQEISLNIESD